MARQILHVDLDAFFVAVEQARNPSLVGKAVVVGGDPGGRGVVATASYEARVFGVHSAMPIRTAKRLAPPDACTCEATTGSISASRALFHAILADYTPLVESGGLDEAYLDITGCEPLVGTPEQAAATIRRRIQSELHIAASVGIASCSSCRKVASDKAKPDGVCLVPEGTEAAFLAPMPLRALPMLGPQHGEAPRLTGVDDAGPAGGGAGHDAGSDVRAARWRDQRPGARRRSLPGRRRAPAKSISREGTFAADVADPAHLRAVLRSFSESVGAQLRRQGRRSRTVSLKLRYEDFTTVNRSVTLPRPVNSDEAIFDAANGMLERLRQAERRPVRLIGVGTSNLVDDAVQLSLEPSRETKAESLSAAFDKVRGKYGSGSLQTGRTAFDKTSKTTGSH